MDPEICKDMIYGSSDPLFSSYHVSYNMVLNMLRYAVSSATMCSNCLGYWPVP
jgi:superfamily II RNA helicase